MSGAFAHKLPRSHYFRAFRGNHEIECDALTLDDTINQAVAHGCFVHKDTMLVHEVDDGRAKGTLHAYKIRKGKAIYRRNPDTGLSERFEPLYPDHMFSIPVDAFEPTRPFDAFLDDPTGLDRNLIEGARK